MNIEIANRLFELRKKNNLSQEELAEKIGVSRQAVSKWERAESSPDTNNLIELARIYQISLDNLLFTSEDTVIKEETNRENQEFVSIGLKGIHVVEKDGSEVYIGSQGIRVKNKGNPDFKEDIEESWNDINKHFFNKLPIPIVVTAIYLVLGFVYNFWHPSWIVFLAIPIYYQIVAMFMAKNIRKKMNLFPYALLCGAAYLLMGFYCALWHPGWLIFLSIPMYYSIVNTIAGQQSEEVKKSD